MGNSVSRVSFDDLTIKHNSSTARLQSMNPKEKRTNGKNNLIQKEMSPGCGDRFFISPFKNRQSVYVECQENDDDSLDDNVLPNLQTPSICSSSAHSEQLGDILDSLDDEVSKDDYLKTRTEPNKETVSCSWLPASFTGRHNQQLLEYEYDEVNDNKDESPISAKNDSSSSCLALLSMLASSSQSRNLLVDTIEGETSSTSSESNTSMNRSSLDKVLGNFSWSERNGDQENRRRRSRSWLSFPSSTICTDLLVPSDTNPIPSSVISDDKEIWIVTTASLPWFTGTAVNPLLRAAYLSRRRLKNLKRCDGGTGCTEKIVGDVNLVIPWLELDTDRKTLYGSEWVDKTQSDQRSYIQEWIEREFSEDIPQNEVDITTIEKVDVAVIIHFYSARYHSDLGSIFPMGGICNKLPVQDSANAICILEEPEHLNYYLAPSSSSWRNRFAHVVGVIHTNYPYYVAHKSAGSASVSVGKSSSKNDTTSNNGKSSSSLLASSVEMFSAWMVQAYCDKVIKLSSALPVYASTKEVVSAIHGIRHEFLKVGRLGLTDPLGKNEVYFLGKLLWAKGLDKLLELQECYKQQLGYYFPMDIYGSGSDQEDIEIAFANNDQHSIPVEFKGRIDHLRVGTHYSIFVNPSESEVLCTTTAEAIAMGKYAIVPKHPSNVFFAQFPNCLTYESSDDFIAKMQFALSSSPQPLSEEHQRLLTWEAATERLIEASMISEQAAYNRQQSGVLQQEHRLASLHRLLGSGRTGDLLRKVCGGGPCAEQYEYEKTLSSSISVSLEVEPMEDTQRNAGTLVN